jgi:hypothetical protein
MMIYLLVVMMISLMRVLHFFLKSPIYTIEEKYAYVEKYLCGLQRSYEKAYGSHDNIIINGTSNYFERGNHSNQCHNKFNDPLHLPKNSKLHDLQESK